MSKIIRLSEVIDRTGLSRSTIYELMKSSLFPAQRRLGLRSVGWLEAEISVWVSTRARPVNEEVSHDK